MEVLFTVVHLLALREWINYNYFDIARDVEVNGVVI